MKQIVFLASSVHAVHPVRQELLDEIRSKTDKWTTIDINENHFSKVPEEHIKSSLGSLEKKNKVEEGLSSVLHTIQGILRPFMAGEDAAEDDDSEGMPAYLTPPGGFPKKKEYLRPKS